MRLVTVFLCVVLLSGCEMYKPAQLNDVAEKAAIEIDRIDDVVSAVLAGVEAEAKARGMENAGEIKQLREQTEKSVDLLRGQVAELAEADRASDILQAITEFQTGVESIDARIAESNAKNAEEITALKDALIAYESTPDKFEGTLEGAKSLTGLLPPPAGDVAALALAGLLAFHRKRLAEAKTAVRQVVGGTEKVLDTMGDEQAKLAKFELKKIQSSKTRAMVEDARSEI